MEKSPIKSVLAEELQNSIRMKDEYEKALAKIPKGCLSKKKVKGHEYYYVVKRESGKVIHEYKGKLSDQEVKVFNRNSIFRSKYKASLSQVKKQIKYLKGCLRGKEAV